MRVALPAILIALALALAAGCRRPEAPPAAPAERRHALAGVVAEVGADRRSITVRHEAIPGVMGAMTMTLPVADSADLDDVAAGDEIEATLRIRAGRSDLLDVRVARPARPAATAVAGPATGPAEVPVGGLVPDVSMTLQDGRVRRLSEDRGRVILLTFIYTRCPLPDFCPLMDRRFKEVAGRLDAVPGRSARFRLLSVSFDPDHDTPPVLAAHARLLGARPPLWSFAVLDRETLRGAAPAFGLAVLPGGAEIRHGLSTSVIGPDGRLAARFEGRDWAVDDLVRAALAADRAGVRGVAPD